MKHMITIILSMIIIIGLTSCASNNESSPAAEGYIFQIDGNRVLVLDNGKEEDFGKTWNEIMENYQGRAIWLQTSEVSKLEVGQKVRYWVDGPVAESFPEQGSSRYRFLQQQLSNTS